MAFYIPFSGSERIQIPQLSYTDLQSMTLVFMTGADVTSEQWVYGDYDNQGGARQLGVRIRNGGLGVFASSNGISDINIANATAEADTLYILVINYNGSTLSANLNGTNLGGSSVAFSDTGNGTVLIGALNRATPNFFFSGRVYSLSITKTTDSRNYDAEDSAGQTELIDSASSQNGTPYGFSDFSSAVIDDSGSQTGPTALVSAAATANSGDTVSLDGSGSTAGTGAITSYDWTVTPTSDAIIANSTSQSTSVTFGNLSSETVYTIRLTVTDENGLTDFDESTITVSAEQQTPGSFTVDTEFERFYQRDFDNTAKVKFVGTHTGITQLDYTINGGGAVNVTGVFGGSNWEYEVDLPDVGEYVFVWTDPSTGDSTTLTVIVGDVFGSFLMQSNGSARGINNQTFDSNAGGATAYLLGNDDVLKPLQDPWDSPVGQVDSATVDNSAGGSWVVVFADYYLARFNVPICFIPNAKGGTTIADWQKGSGEGLYESSLRRMSKFNKVKLIFSQIGESDSLLGTTETEYKNGFKVASENLFRDLGFRTDMFLVSMHLDLTNVFREYIANAQSQLMAECTYITVGQPLYDIDISEDNLHFQSDASIQEVGRRVAEDVFAAYYASDIDNCRIDLEVSGIPEGDYQTVLLSPSGRTIYNQIRTYNALGRTGFRFPYPFVASASELAGFVIADNKAQGAIIVEATTE